MPLRRAKTQDVERPDLPLAQNKGPKRTAQAGMNTQLQIPGFTNSDIGDASGATETIKLEKPRLRDYQQAIADEALGYLRAGRSPLVQLFTGLGKTRLAANVVRNYPGRVLWYVHRYELVLQAKRALEEELGEAVDLETVDSHSGAARVVVASKDTIRGARRLERLRNYEDFGLIVADEAHHTSAATYWTVFNAYPKALRMGLTATPGRLDKRPLYAFDCATVPFGLTAGQEQGWLVPIRAKRVAVRSIDLSGVNTVAGDFNQGELDAIYRSEANLHAVAKALVDHAGVGPAIHFSSGVDTGERLAEILCRQRPGMARFVSGKTPEEERRLIFSEFGKRYQVLVNVGVVTEGVDLPAAAVVSIGRPTKSSSLFIQMIGRGVRPLPGIDKHTTPKERRAAIASSTKPHCLILDFVGNTGRHSVQTAAAVFDGANPDVAKKLQSRLESGEELDLAGALAEEIAADAKRQQERQRRKKQEQQRRNLIIGKVQLTEHDVMLIGLGGQPDETDQVKSFLDGPPGPGQVAELVRLGVDMAGLETARAARVKLAELRKELDYATPAQLSLIRKHNPDMAKTDLKRSKAGYLISQIMRRWKR